MTRHYAISQLVTTRQLLKICEKIHQNKIIHIKSLATQQNLVTS